MDERRTPNMSHFEWSDADDNGPRCSNTSPVTFERRGGQWVHADWDSNKWEGHIAELNVMICLKCGRRVTKV